MASKGKSVTQKVFTGKVEEAAETMPLDQALAVAGSEAGIDEKRLSPAMREELGLDSEDVRLSFGAKVVEMFENATKGEFPEWITKPGDGVSPDAQFKAKVDIWKSLKGTLETATVTKKEKHIIAEEEFAGKSDRELEYFRLHGKWPVTLNGDSSDSVN